MSDHIKLAFSIDDNESEVVVFSANLNTEITDLPNLEELLHQASQKNELLKVCLTNPYAKTQEEEARTQIS